MLTLPEAITAVRAGRKLGKVRCPASRNHKHGDRSPSLKVFIGTDGWVAFKCWSADCTRDEVLAAAGLKVRDLGPDRPFQTRQAQVPRNRPTAAPAALPARSIGGVSCALSYPCNQPGLRFCKKDCTPSLPSGVARMSAMPSTVCRTKAS